ncbi:GMC oxidoreductase [Streptomyces litmocidini]|uniref:GMC oxidoreductase n=1 Tax=Streptomyces litmocidini TaxID=67318 RepID=UPI0033F175D2
MPGPRTSPSGASTVSRAGPSTRPWAGPSPPTRPSTATPPPPRPWAALRTRGPWAVVDSGGAVEGVGALRVADASIIPEVPSSTTNVTVIMLAERIYQQVYAP